MKQWLQQYATTIWLTAAVLAVLVIWRTEPDTSDGIEVIWAGMGATGSVFAGTVWWRRWLVDQWRRKTGTNGWFALSCMGYLVGLGIALGIELLMLASGLSAMATPPSIRAEVRANDAFTAWCVIGMGALCTIGSWFANYVADLQGEYAGKHPED